jgi:hypothetical protein
MCSLCPLCSIEDDGNWMVANDGDNASVSARMFIKDEKNVAVFPSPQASIHQVMITILGLMAETNRYNKEADRNVAHNF